MADGSLASQIRGRIQRSIRANNGTLMCAWSMCRRQTETFWNFAFQIVVHRVGAYCVRARGPRTRFKIKCTGHSDVMRHLNSCEFSGRFRYFCTSFVCVVCQRRPPTCEHIAGDCVSDGNCRDGSPTRFRSDFTACAHLNSIVYATRDK